ncbi:MAG TPA: hypothetical protein DDZ39_09965 [Flavobacteriaceae bacterium]|jgi:hypothetical protein|nr:hypothetical protein [Flavobacteriaceae bacterium]HBS12216.1 hypothetical protein [Flavobacteriaceae bacterium]
MQTKLTLTIEESIIKQSKKYAKEKGRSLSELIENYLKVILDKDMKGVRISQSIQKLQGSVKLPDDFNYKKELVKAISKKHKL